MKGFNSRTPGGVRPGAGKGAGKGAECFNSRTPGGVRPGGQQSANRPKQVSIHAPREGCDARWQVQDYRTLGFNSRTPGGVRLFFSPATAVITLFQFTHPGRGATFVAE